MNPYLTTSRLNCHCTDCHKITGGAFASVVAVDQKNFKLIGGTPKTYSKTADSGNTVTSFSCSECGNTLFRGTASLPDWVMIKAGVLDDLDSLDSLIPEMEVHTGRRTAWILPTTGARQIEIQDTAT